MNKIGIFGGTFDPIHNAHISTALCFYRYLKLDKVIFIPTNIPPHKNRNHLTSAENRLEMCQLALNKYSYFEVSDIEVKRKGRSYTYKTLQDLKNFYKESQFYFILGADMFITINKWKYPEEIFKNVILCTVSRDNINKASLEAYSKEIEKLGAVSVIVDSKPVDISSTKIRNNIKNNRSISGLVPSEVEDYIYKNRLYMEWFDGYGYL